MNKDNGNESNKDDAGERKLKDTQDDSCPPHLLEEKMRGLLGKDDDGTPFIPITPFILLECASDLGWTIPTKGHWQGTALNLTFTNETHGEKDLSFDFSHHFFNQSDKMTLRRTDGSGIVSGPCVGNDPVDFWHKHTKGPSNVHLHWVHYEFGTCYWNLLATQNQGLNVWAEKQNWIHHHICGEVLFVPKNWVDCADDCTAFPVLPENKLPF